MDENIFDQPNTWDGGDKWWENYENIIKVADYLAQDMGSAAVELVEFLRKPWKWTIEYHEMLEEEK